MHSEVINHRTSEHSLKINYNVITNYFEVTNHQISQPFIQNQLQHHNNPLLLIVSTIHLETTKSINCLISHLFTQNKLQNHNKLF